MTAGLASVPVRDAGGRESVDSAVRQFLDDWRHGEPNLDDYRGARGAGDPPSVLAALVKADLQHRFERGERPAVAGYLARFPELRGRADRVISLIYEEFCLREERGERPDTDEFCDRYADWKDSLASQLRYHRVLSRVVGAPAAVPRFPEPGEHFEEFLIRVELGRGGAGRVYLARDESLGGRDVALKVSPDRGSEPSILGRLGHPNIVPVHSVAFQPESRLQGLCMPYRPGLPLDEVIRRADPASRPRSARALWEALARPPHAPPPSDAEGDGGAESPAPERPPAGPGWAGFPARGTYADAVAWVAATLAGALHYAHARGIHHRDVKPANVLLTYRDGPQLLDFNLAHDPHTAAQAEAALRGGTLPYMAPEQLEAFLDPGRWDRVGAAADVYALGLVLREMLDGKAPETPDPKLPLPRAIRALLDRRADLKPDLRSVNPRVPHALEAVVTRCLAADPADRYPDAVTLADDLGRFLDRRPLFHAENPSRRERAGNWARRNARRLTLAAAAVAVAAFTAAWALGPRPAAVASAAVRTPAPKPGPETDPAFLRAVAAFDEGRKPDLDALSVLAEKFSESGLVNFYRCAALEGQDKGAAVDELLPRVWERPEAARAELTAWGRSHPKLADLAVRLGTGMLERTPKGDRRSAHLDTAERTLALARSLSPDNFLAHYRLVQVAETRGDYAAAHATLTGLIETVSASGGGSETSPLPLSHLLWIRSRLATALGRSLLADQAAGAAAVAEAVRYLREAVNDSDAVSRSVRPDDDKTRYDIAWVLCETKLALGDGLARQGSRTEAEASFREAGRLLDTVRPSVGKFYDKDEYLKFDDLAGRVGQHLGAPGEKPTAGPGGSPNSGK
jgi:serine/threonine protein kinase